MVHVLVFGPILDAGLAAADGFVLGLDFFSAKWAVHGKIEQRLL